MGSVGVGSAAMTGGSSEATDQQIFRRHFPGETALFDHNSLSNRLKTPQRGMVTQEKNQGPAVTLQGHGEKSTNVPLQQSIYAFFSGLGQTALFDFGFR